MDATTERETAVNGAALRAHEIPLTARQASWAGYFIKTLAMHTERAARWFVMLFACALFGLTFAYPDRLVIALVFAVVIFAPMWWRTMFPRKEPRDG